MVGLLTGLFILYTKNDQWLWLANRRSTPEEIPSSPEWDDDIIPYSKMVRPSSLLSPEEDRSREFPASFLVNKSVTPLTMCQMGFELPITGHCLKTLITSTLEGGLPTTGSVRMLWQLLMLHFICPRHVVS